MGKATDAFVVVSFDRLVATDIICGVSDDDETLTPGGTMSLFILPEEPSARALLHTDCFKDVDEYVGTAVG